MNRRGFIGSLLGLATAVKITGETREPEPIKTFASAAPVFPTTKVFSTMSVCTTQSFRVPYSDYKFSVKWKTDDEDLES